MVRAFAAAIALVVVAACAQEPRSAAPSTPEIRVAGPTADDAGGAVSVVGLPPDDLVAIRGGSLTLEEWHSILRVVGAAGPDDRDMPAVSGSYAVAGDTLRFVPHFPLDPRVAHWVVFDPTRLPSDRKRTAEPWRSRPIELAIASTVQQGPSTTRVLQVFPTDVLLENQLRIYIHFSASMGARRANDHVRLLNEQDEIVAGALLPLDVGLWNSDLTRFTVLFDPGRVKRGILPHEEMGRPLLSGRRYTLVVDREWRDAQGRPLVEVFRREFQVVPGVFEPIVPAEWRFDAPVAGARDPLRVGFPRALDHAIADRALYVTTGDGRVVDGSVAVNDASTRWSFTPHEAWSAGEYALATLSVLEDPAGNRVGRAFDHDPRQPRQAGEDGSETHGEARIPFTILLPDGSR